MGWRSLGRVIRGDRARAPAIAGTPPADRLCAKRHALSLEVSRRQPSIFADRLLIAQEPSTIRLTSPRQVSLALDENPAVVSWLLAFSARYQPPPASVHLIFPCASTKPFDSSQSYKQFSKTLSRLNGGREFIHLYTISEPFGLVPGEFVDELPRYDCPGLFRWWCDQHGEPYEEEFLERAVSQLARFTAPILSRMEGRVIAVVRTYSSGLVRREDHTHFRILQEAARLAGQEIEFIPTRRLVQRIVKAKGRFAWDRYGPAHPMVQKYLGMRLDEVLIDG